MRKRHGCDGPTRWYWIGLFAVLALEACWPPVAGGSNLRRSAIVRAVEQAKPAVVNIHGRKSVRPEGRTPSGLPEAARQVNGMGTGIIIDERGYILTNFHVVDGVGQIKVTLADEQTVTAKLVAHDPKTDLAILKIPTDQPLTVIRIGTSSDLMPGEEVIAVGNAYGYMHTVTRGIISALHRSVQVSEDQHYPDLIQTDASINPGNSGGPLLNIDGEMVGINVAVRVGAQGIGFALPIDEATEVAARLLRSERVASLGATGQTHLENGRARFVITNVEPDSDAERVGLRIGDVVTHVDGRSIVRSLDWERSLLDVQPGARVQLDVERESQVVSLVVTAVGTQTLDSTVESLAWRFLGLKLTPVDANTLLAAGETRYRGGLRVTAVRPDSPAAQRGVRTGDVLVGMHKWETISLDNISYILNSPEFRAAQPVKFYVVRGDETLFGSMRVSFGSSN